MQGEATHPEGFHGDAHEILRCGQDDKALPNVAPTKNSGVTSPHLNPTTIVNLVKRSLMKKS